MTRKSSVVPSVLTFSLILSGCSLGPGGPATGYRPYAPTRLGAPNSPPIASQPIGTQPVGTPASTSNLPIATQPPFPMTSQAPVQVLPYAALPYQAFNTNSTGTSPYTQLAAMGGGTIDGRPIPLFYRDQIKPASAGARPRRTLVQTVAATDTFANQGAIIGGLPPTPQEDLRYRGGRTIRDLKYLNIYVGGKDAWLEQDWRNVDKSLLAAMSDQYLNNVLLQYFNNDQISSKFLGSFFLSGWRPQFVSKGDLQRQVRNLFNQGALNNFDLPNTCLNFMLPKGTVLGDPMSGEDLMLASKIIPKEEAEDSTGGLGGYHSSLHFPGGKTVYFAVGVYSERRTDGRTNGIPVFDQNWKNVVATMYHELQEFRTDPDVEDAVQNVGPDSTRHLGWTSDSGLEVGDYPIMEANSMKLVFREVPSSDGSGMIPVQLQYSNAVHGPEGPIVDIRTRQPWTGSGQSGPSQPGPGPGPTQPTNPPVSQDPDLERLISSWNQLEDFVRKAILRLAESR